MKENQTLIDFARTKEGWARELAVECSSYLEKARMRVCVPLSAVGNLLGLLTVEDRIGKDPFAPEDFDLLKTIADQTAGILLNLKLHQRLQTVKETEAIQTMSAFMMHDLKNLASMLSLTMENLPVHFNNPDFRQDVIRLIRQSVSKINDMCSHLVLTSQQIQLSRKPVDLNDLVRSTLSRLNGPQGVTITQDLHQIPILMMDADQIQKVLTNLVLNAQEAVGDKGEVRVSTGQRNGWVVLTVSDTGCGMSKAFMEQSLFRPFKTTKKRGMGIGLYHSRMIVEAHQGRIEVESEAGKGSTFRVVLRSKQ
jgi:putative PEP-CTERM system histidine kinase